MDVPEEDNAQISKRQAIQAIMKDTSLTPHEKQEKIQEFMAGGGKTGETAKEEGEPLSRQDQVKAIMGDASLPMEEKQKKVREVMSLKGSLHSKSAHSHASARRPAPNAAAGATSSQVAVDAAARKMKRESNRNLKPGGGASVASISSDDFSEFSETTPPTPSAAAQETSAAAQAVVAQPSMPNMKSNSPPRSPVRADGAEAPSRQELAKEVMKGTTLTPQAKQQKLRDIMVSPVTPSHPSTARMKLPSAPMSGDSLRRTLQVPSSPRVGASAASGPTPDPAARKMAREANRSLTTSPMQSPARSARTPPRVSPTRSPRSRSPKLPPASSLPEVENEDNSGGLEPKSRQDLVRDVMRDASLTPQEKQQKVRDIMASSATVKAPQNKLSRRTLQVPSSPLVGVVSLSTGAIDPAARKMARESSRNQSSASPLVSLAGRTALASPMQAPRSSPGIDLPVLPLEEGGDGSGSEEMKPAASRQDLVREVMRNASLTPQERQQKVRDIMASSAIATAPQNKHSRRSLQVPSSPMVGAAALSTGAVDPAARKIARESSRGNITSSSPLVSPDGRKSISSLQVQMSLPGEPTRSLSSRPPPAPPIMEVGGGEEHSPKLSRQDMVKQVMSDNSLTTQEKQQKVRGIMSQKPPVAPTGTPRTSRRSLQVPARMSSLPENAKPKSGEEDSKTGRAITDDELSFGGDDAERGGSYPQVGAAAVGATTETSILVDPAARKLQRESSRNIPSGSIHSRQSLNDSPLGSTRSSRNMPGPSNHGQQTPALDAMRQSMIQAVKDDQEITEEERREQIQQILSGRAGMGVVSTEPAQLTIQDPTPSQVQVDGSSKPETNENEEELQVAGDDVEGGGTVEVPAEVAAFVAGQEPDENAIVATDIYREEDLDEEEDLRKRRFLWVGCCCFCLLVIAIVVPLVALAPDDEAIVVIDEEPSAAPSLFPTQAPSVSPTPSAALELLLELENLYPSYDDYLQAFNSSDSIQYQALYWATGEGNPGSISGFDPRMINRFALATFYFATNGDEWVRCKRDGTNCDPGEEWLLADDECGWLAITCAEDTTDVTQIFFPPTGQAGENNIAGTLPFELSFLTDLTRITISRNNIGGSIPAAWSDLTKLEAVILSENQLTGELPSSLINNNQNLRQLRLQGNQISQLPQDPIRSAALTLLDLQNNALEGPIPEGLEGLSVLRRAELTGNNLIGEIPAGLCALKADPGDLAYLTADCDEVICACCDNDCAV
ncbi:MAG: hypothetical protein SGBAC_005321 [Bacillariaceae sp.]